MSLSYCPEEIPQCCCVAIKTGALNSSHISKSQYYCPLWRPIATVWCRSSFYMSQCVCSLSTHGSTLRCERYQIVNQAHFFCSIQPTVSLFWRKPKTLVFLYTRLQFSDEVCATYICQILPCGWHRIKQTSSYNQCCHFNVLIRWINYATNWPFLCHRTTIIATA